MNEKLIEIIKNVGNVIIDNKEYLTELDRNIGDGDHGVNLARGFEKVNLEIDALKDKQPYEIFSKIAMILISNVGGASGAIYGSAFLKAGQFLKDKNIEDNNVIVEMWNQMILAIQARGNAKLNDKTMLDTIIPSYEAFKIKVKETNNLKEAFKEAAKYAYQGMENTKKIVANKGRASYLEKRSLNHIDPGAYSSYLIIKTVSELI